MAKNVVRLLAQLVFSCLIWSCGVQSVFTPVRANPAIPVRVGCHINWGISPHVSGYLSCLGLFPPISRRSVEERNYYYVKKPNIASLLLLLAGDISLNPGPVVQTSKLKISNANIRSLSKNTEALKSFVTDEHPHCLLLTETWLTPTHTDSHLKELTPIGYKLLHVCRNDGGGKSRGGGVGCLVDERFDSKQLSSPIFSTFENMIVSAVFDKVSLNFVNIYRPPNLSSSVFFEEFQELLSNLITLQSSFIISGDFNLHLDDPTLADVQTFNSILDNFNLVQHVTGATHLGGHTLDLFITPQESNYITSVEITEALSDHFSLTATLNFDIPKVPPKTITYRAINKINVSLFKNDLAKSDLLLSPCSDSSSLYDQYHSTLSSLIDKHAPLKTKNCSSRRKDPWITDEFLAAKRKKRNLEKTWRRTKFSFDKFSLTKQTHICNNLLSKAKNDWYTSMIEQNKNKPRNLWSCINKILHRSQSSPLPDFSDLTSLSNNFGKYFIDKISKIRAILDSKAFSEVRVEPNYVAPMFSSFTPLSEADVKKLINAAPNKSCDLDPCPTTIVKECVDQLTTPLMSIINNSLSTGVFPKQFKQAHVRPLLKKPSLNRQDLKNYRPVSNLNFVSKLIEKVVADQIKKHLDLFNLDNPFQSAYKAHHSTESALLTVTNDILNSMGKGNVTALTLLDLSAAFDTIDHRLLLNRLKEWFGIDGIALEWLADYLTDRCQLINIQGKLSVPLSLLYGVPQGSILGPLLFILYTSPLSQLIEKCKSLKHHLYADDTQIYTSFNTSNINSKISDLQSTLISVQDWMFANKLKLNPDKTEFMLLGNKAQQNKVAASFPIEVLGNNIIPAAKAKNLGVILDPELNYSLHINNIVKVCNYFIRDIRRIRKHLDIDTAIALANALVSSRLDYCNALFHGIPKKYLNKLQRVQNSLARVVTKAPRFTSSAPLLAKLHWLPVTSRINFKLACITYKAIYKKQPASLTECIRLRSSNTSTRFNDHLLLQHPPVGKNNYGRRAFSSTAPTIWNKIPLPIRSAPSILSFRQHLKTFYFKNPPVPPNN